MHDDNRTPTRWKHLKGSPNGRPRDYSRSVIGLNVKLKSGLIVAIPHRGLPPLIATQIDQYAHQPGFLSFNTVRHGIWRPGGTQERLLDEVKGVICAGRESSREAVEALVMEIEQRGGTFRRLLRGGRREGTRDRLAAHTYLDARGLRNDGSVVLPELVT
jgi:hypothetical protein